MDSHDLSEMLFDAESRIQTLETENATLRAQLAAIKVSLDYDEIESATTEINVCLPEDRETTTCFVHAIHRAILARIEQGGERDK